MDQLGNRRGGSIVRGSSGERAWQQDGGAVGRREDEAQLGLTPRVSQGCEGAGPPGTGQSGQAGAGGEGGGQGGWGLLQRLELGQNSIVGLQSLSLATFSGTLGTTELMRHRKLSRVLIAVCNACFCIL